MSASLIQLPRRQSSVAAPRYCIYCNEELLPDAQRCIYCGASLANPLAITKAVRHDVPDPLPDLWTSKSTQTPLLSTGRVVKLAVQGVVLIAMLAIVAAHHGRVGDWLPPVVAVTALLFDAGRRATTLARRRSRRRSRVRERVQPGWHTQTGTGRTHRRGGRRLDR